MKVEVDQVKCTGIGICVKEMPQLFRFQEGSKHATVIRGPEAIPRELEPRIVEVAAKCPNGAIKVSRD
jgi:ferredoxin